MAQRSKNLIWGALAEELLGRADIRPEIRRSLETALEKDGAARTRGIKNVLAKALASPSKMADDSPIRRFDDIAAAKQSLALIEHGINRVARADDLVGERLCRFLSDAVRGYADAHSRAGAPSDLESVGKVARRVLDAVAARRTMQARTRIGVLKVDEVAALASGARTPQELGTIVAGGDAASDLRRWRADAAVSDDRKSALQSGDFADGEYLFTVLRPTPQGQILEVHPIASDGWAAPAPIITVEAPRSVEPVSAAAVLIAPVVTRVGEPRQQLPNFRGEDAGARKQDLAVQEGARLRAAAVAINQARVALYGEILRARTDLRGAARVAAERRLERIQLESDVLAGGEVEHSVLRGFIDQWSKELSRDVGRLSARIGLPSQASYNRQLGALSKMGALQQRLDNLRRSADGLEPKIGTYTIPGDGGRVLAQSQASSSVFDELPAVEMARAGYTTLGQSLAGERLTTDVMLRDAQRAMKPSRDVHRLVKDVAAAGKRLRQALTTMSTAQETGLAMSSDLKPLLRPKGMPAVIRPDTRSPMLRHYLLPAMERVSGPKRTFARRNTGAAQSVKLPPAALYGLILGEAGRDLADRMPEAAKSILTGMGELSQRIADSGTTPSLAALTAAGSEIANQVSMLAPGDEDVGVVGEPSEGDLLADAVGDAVGLAIEAPVTAADQVTDPAMEVDELAGRLEGESTQISSEIRAAIEPFVELSSTTRVMAGPVASAALDEMGALGATVGRDIYLHKNVLGGDPRRAATVLGHEAVHAQSFGGSVESQEEAAYAIEEQIRASFELGELAKERRPDVPGKGEGDPSKKADEDSKKEIVIDELADAVLALMKNADHESVTRFG
jgi:hypothetical protein